LYKQSVLEAGVLRMMISLRGWKYQEARKLCNVFLIFTFHQLIFCDRLRRMKSVMHVPCIGRRVVVGNPEGKRLLGWHRQVLENNIKMDFKK